MKAPDKIYVFQHGINAFDPLWHFTKSKEKHTESHEYIRKDLIEHIIGGALGPQDALNKIRSL